jgi:UDP-2,3-diacylglucosamine hydrolase
MRIDLEIDNGPVYFLSDAHLGPDAEQDGREDSLLQFLRHASAEAAGLFVLGDLFDFWFEYRWAVPKGAFRVARVLRDAVEAGIPTVFLGGNHDFWAGSYLKAEVGLAAYDRAINVRLQGRTIHLAHGDGLGPGDLGYKVLKRILRNRLAIAAYRSIHPDLGIPLAHRISALSRRRDETPEILMPKIVRDVVRPRLQGEVTAMAMGHVHYPVHFQEDGRDFLVLGDWIRHFTFARLSEGRFRLYRWADGREQEIPPAAFPVTAS